MLHQDLYFTPEYGKLYEKLEQATFKSFSYQDENGEIYYQYLKRKVPCLIDGNQYYDAMTPYGYGGPLAVHVEPGKEKRLIEQYEKALNEHLREEKVICEFVRFHPMVKNADFFSGMYELRNRRTAVYTSLAADDPIAAEFNKSTRRLIRQAMNRGVTTEIKLRPDKNDLQKFVHCYYQNMDALNASDYYYFSEDYFEDLWREFNDQLIIVYAYVDGQLAGAELGLSERDIFVCHLTGVTEIGRLHEVPRVLIAAETSWAKQNGFHYLFQGCGLSLREEDSLLQFKKSFTKNGFYDYWQGARICDPVVYSKLCQIADRRDDGTYFPAYRKP